MTQEFQYDIYMICPVRNATLEEIGLLKEYRDKFTKKGKTVCYPAESTNQNDTTGGYQICEDHCNEIHCSDEVHVYWNPDSSGSYVDLGTAFPNHFVHGRNIQLINRNTVEEMVDQHKNNGVTKSYEHVLLKLDNLAKL
ncbi:hypothetical protein HN903_01705 [archaeon]|jgi:hypothetical protein|nr:hypothetical protein [archaeon]MBT7128448.1 hypothetical protein [archaeon]